MITFKYLHFLLIIVAFSRLSVANDDSTVVKQVTGPKLVFEEESFDFGTIEPGKIAEHIFQFRNVGMDTVFIKDVTSG